tara:strand:- start:554 stop:913 length:360 start_codon:yes stop_codon:yes gene_type:complete
MSEQLDNLMRSQSLLAAQVFELEIQEDDQRYLSSSIYVYSELKNHSDTARTIPYDSSSGMNYALYDYLTNTTLDLSYTAEYYYTPDYRNGEVFRYIRSSTESTGSASTQPPSITTINII